MENKLLTPDYNKKLYRIEIIVCQNCNEFLIDKIDKDCQISYDSIIGTLEITKIGFIKQQSEINRKQHKKENKKHKKNKNNDTKI